MKSNVDPFRSLSSKKAINKYQGRKSGAEFLSQLGFSVVDRDWAAVTLSTLTLITPPSPTNVEAGRPFTDLVFLLKYLHTIVLMVYREKVKLALFAVSYN